MAKASPELVALRKACKEASKNVRVLKDRPLQQNLEQFCDSLADAYRQGVEEAPGEIVQRLLRLIVRQQAEDDHGTTSRLEKQP